MIRQLLIVLTLASFVFIHCSKSDNGNKAVIGNWTFRSKTSQVGPYPSMFTIGYPSSLSTESTTRDEIRMSFGSNGNFSFHYYDEPIQSGTFKILNDTL